MLSLLLLNYGNIAMHSINVSIGFDMSIIACNEFLLWSYLDCLHSGTMHEFNEIVITEVNEYYTKNEDTLTPDYVIMSDIDEIYNSFMDNAQQIYEEVYAQIALWLLKGYRIESVKSINTIETRFQMCLNDRITI